MRQSRENPLVLKGFKELCWQAGLGEVMETSLSSTAELWPAKLLAWDNAPELLPLVTGDVELLAAERLSWESLP